jgi:metallo-beta-lactamase family protein
MIDKETLEMKIQFLGAARQVTGSCYFLEAGGLKLLIDCGLFQERDYQERNWDPCPIPPKDLDAILLTHAHLDHAGLLPKWVREGFSGTVYATSASVDLAKIVLLDSARIHEEDAAFKKKRHQREGRSGPRPELPLYTVEDAEAVFPLLRQAPYEDSVALNEKVTARFHDAGHILGSAMLEIEVRENGAAETLLFSGDIGQWDKPIIRDPSLFNRADYVVMESTYGDRDHDQREAIEDRLAEVISDTVARGGNVVIPTFAIERAQELMYYMSRLVREKRIPKLLSFLDSPMAVGVTEVFRNHKRDMDEEAQTLYETGQPPFNYPGLTLVQNVNQSKAINNIRGSCVIMSASGMCTAGRIKHHLVHNISNPNCTILFVGYQAKQTLGRSILEGAKQVRIHGEKREVKARIEQIHGFSAHADRAALLRWVTHLESPPKRVFLTHGEEEAAEALAKELQQRTRWTTHIPRYLEEWSSNGSH